MIKLVIFDLDGTLVNAYPAVSRSVNYTLKQLGFKPRSNALIKRSVGHGDRQLMTSFVGHKLTDKALAMYRPYHTQALQRKGGVKLLPGAHQALTFLKSQGIALAIASNRPTLFTQLILKKLKILKFFDSVLCADAVARPKPAPDLLKTIAKRLKVASAAIVYVGDMGLDIECARRAGIRMVAVAGGSSSMKELKCLKPWGFIAKISKLNYILKPRLG